MSTIRWYSMAAVCTAVAVGFIALAQSGEPIGPKDESDKQLKWILGDIKRPLKQVTKEPITEQNYRKIIDGLKTNLHCNGVRVYIDPDIKDPANYPKVYRDVIDYAKEQKLAIFANPFETLELRLEKFGRDKAAFTDWIVKYANHFRPEFLGPFNESGWNANDMVEMVQVVRKGLKYSPKIVGPDMIHVSKSNEVLGKNRQLVNVFDVIGAHNAAKDEGATAEAWRELRQRAGKPAWATENPRPFSVKNSAGKEIGIGAVMDSKSIEGLVIYLAYPGCIKADGSLTEKGREIEQGIAKP